MSEQAVLDGQTVPNGAEGRKGALVLRMPAAEPTGRALPAFLAQLIACHRRMPDFRKARQTAPGRAASAYGRPETRIVNDLDVKV